MRRFLTSFAILSASLATLPEARAHRVDEYLEATRLSIDTTRVEMEMDLTPGIALATEVFRRIDLNRDGEISNVESDAYARHVLGCIELSADRVPAVVELVDAQFPKLSDMQLGIGTIRLRAFATIRAAGTGRHQLAFLNMHRPESGVYLVNALVPANPGIQITDQRRDPAQHGLTLDYTVTADPPSGRTFALLAGLVLGGRWFLGRRAAQNAA